MRTIDEIMDERKVAVVVEAIETGEKQLRSNKDQMATRLQNAEELSNLKEVAAILQAAKLTDDLSALRDRLEILCTFAGITTEDLLS